MNNNKKPTIAIVPGSFDPITNGHVFIVKEALKLYDKVILAVMINSEKTYKFSLAERKEIAKSALENMQNVEVISFDGWLYELAQNLKADAIVKGYRNDVDLKYEQQMAKFNQQHAPNTKTVLIKASDDITILSSTLVRERIDKKESLDSFLPNSAINKIEEILTRNNKKCREC